MRDSARGIIRNRDYATQVRDFSGLRYGTITPSDIDAIIDFGYRFFVIIEVKRLGTPLSQGQRLLLERLVKGLAAGGTPALAISATHETDGDIDFANCSVVETCSRGGWLTPVRERTVREEIDGWLTAKGLGHYLQGMDDAQT